MCISARAHTCTCMHICTYREVSPGSCADPQRSILNCCVEVVGLAGLMKIGFYKYKNLLKCICWKKKKEYI